MSDLRFSAKESGKGYVSNNVLVPKSAVNSGFARSVRGVLSFVIGDEPDIEEDTRQAVGRKKKIVELWDETESHLVVPRHFFTGRQWPDAEWVEEELEWERVDLPDSIVPREAQAAALEDMRKWRCGTVSLACGSGKSALALKYIVEDHRPAIVVVNQGALIHQWSDEIRLHIGADVPIGVVQGGERSWEGSPITLATVQTLARRRDELGYDFRRYFGTAFFDECFAPDTLVDGKPIEFFRAGDEVSSFDKETGKLVRSEIVRTFKRRALRLMRLSAEGHRVYCTPSHRFFTRSGWVRAVETLGEMVTIVEEGRPSRWARVDRLDYVDPGPDGSFGGRCPGGFVHDLEVRGTHTYFANGIGVSNCHHMAAPYFIRAADLFYGDRFGLTATATRADGYENLYQYHLGPVIHLNLEQDLVPECSFYELEWEPTQDQVEAMTDRAGNRSHGKYCVMIGGLPWRNEFVLDRVSEHVAEGRQVLVLAHSVESVRALRAMWKKPEAGLITSPDVKDYGERIRILAESNPVFATFQLAREALNKKSLSALHVASTFGSSNDLQQSIGRALREMEGKLNPVGCFYVDAGIKMSKRQGLKLQRHLRALNYPVSRVEVEVDLHEE